MRATGVSIFHCTAKANLIATAAALMFLTASTSCSEAGKVDPAAVKGSSLLLITLDTTRADVLGCYGGPEGYTPNLDEIAREGIRFDQAYSVAPITLASHATILTGLYPFEHGVRDNAIFRLPKKVTTIAERLKGSGYSTIAVMGAFVLHSTFGLDQGFDVYSDVPQRRLNLGAAEDQRTATEVVDEALRILGDEEKTEPLFLWVHFFDPHSPYQPPPSFMQRVRDIKPSTSSPGSESLRRRYIGEVAYMDHEIGRLIEGVGKLVPQGRLLTTLVSDHGEGLMDHGEETHGFQLYDTTVRVPLILHHRNLPRGIVIRERISLVDFAPAVMRLLGFEFEDATDMDLSAVLGMKEGDRKTSPVYFKAAHPFYNYNWSPLFGVIEGDLKLIEGPKPELYDLVKDPRERNDIHGQHVEKVKRMRSGMGKMISQMKKSERIELSQKDWNRIASLGYAGSSASAREEKLLFPGYIEKGRLDPKKGLEIWRRCSKARSLALSKSRRDRVNAVDMIRKVLKEDPDNPTFLSHAGTVYFHAGMNDDAIRVLRRSLQLLESSTSREVLATCLFNLGRIEEATALLQINYELHPYDLISRYKLGDALLRQGFAAEALSHFKFFLEEYKTRDDLYTTVKSLMLQAERKSSR